MANEILIADARGQMWTCSYVVTAGGGVASGESEKGSAGQMHYWRCVKDDHARTISVPLHIDFRVLTDAERTKCIEDAFDISGEWERQ